MRPAFKAHIRGDSGLQPPTRSLPPLLEPLEPRLLMAANLQIMTLGDSITLGTGGAEYSSGHSDIGRTIVGGYRTELMNLLVRDAGLAPGTELDFVGTMRDGPFNFSGRNFDAHHQAYPGYEADDGTVRSLVWALQNDKNGDRQPDGDGLGVFDVVQPDVILLHIGTNSMSEIQRPNDPNRADLQLTRLLQFLRDVPQLADTKIILAKIIPDVGSSEDIAVREANYQNSVAYNQAISQIVNKLANSGNAADRDLASRITIVDMASAGNWVRDTNGNGIPDSPVVLSFLMDEDGTHPTQKGYGLMADVWYQALWDARVLVDEHANAGNWDQASNINVSRGRAQGSGVIGLQGDTDLVYFTSAATGLTRISVAPAHADLNLRFTLYDGSRNVIKIVNDGARGEIETLSTSSLVAGRDYYLLVETVGGDLGEYAVNVAGTSVGDFNDDTHDDLVWHNTRNGATRIWMMNGASKIDTAAVMPWRNARWQLRGVADFNSDGEADLLFRNMNNGRNRVWLMNNTEKVGTMDLPQFKHGKWDVGALGDFNGDGETDILWRHNRGGWMRMWFMDDNTMTSSESVERWKTGWALIGTADFNNDGNVDLLWNQPGQGRNRVWFMDAHEKTGQTDLQRWRLSGWVVSQLADLNSDGQKDIVWRHTNTGRNRVWYMGGAQRLGAAPLQTWSNTQWQMAGGPELSGKNLRTSSNFSTRSGWGRTASTSVEVAHVESPTTSATITTEPVTTEPAAIQQTVPESTDLLNRLVSPRTTSFVDQLLAEEERL